MCKPLSGPLAPPAGVVLVVPSDEPLQLPRELLAELHRYSGVSMVTMPAAELRSLVGLPALPPCVDESFVELIPGYGVERATLDAAPANSLVPLRPIERERPLDVYEQVQLWRHIKWVLLLLVAAAVAIACVAGCAPMSYTNGDNPNFKWGVRVAPMDEFNDASSSWP